MRDHLESLADIQHEIWSHWMKYLFKVSETKADGSCVIPSDLVERWKKQIETPYNQLTEKEKDSDREQAEKILNFLMKSGN